MKLRTYVAGVLSKGVITPGWYSILTGLALLFVAYLLFGVSSDDAAAPFVAAALGVTGLWLTARGIWTEVRHRRAA